MKCLGGNKQMQPLISIICTVKNGESTIKDTILSAFNQNYSNLEIIVIDDGSSDNTLKILSELRKEIGKKIKIYPTDGIGRVEALNLAISKSNGEYISNLDADDLIHPQKIKLQVKELNKNKDLFLIATDYVIVYNNEKTKWLDIQKDYKTRNVQSDLLYRNSIIHSSVLMRKDILIKLGKYNIGQKSQIDYELWLRAYSKGCQMKIMELPLTAKRIHADQSFENKKRLTYTLRSFFLQSKYILNYPKYYHYLIYILGSLLLSQLPFSLRNKIKEVLGVER